MRTFSVLVVVGLSAACDAAVTAPDRAAPKPPLPPATAAAPAGFQETPFVALGFDPTAMEFAPDGRLFVADQAGWLRVVKNGSLLPTPFLSLSVEATAERGLLGVAFDPDFAGNGFVYVYYTSSATGRNRVSRFTASAANPDVAESGSQVVLLDGLAGAAGYHNGGAIHFGTDGKLYVGVGDSDASSNAQDVAVPEGKLLRINPDGSVPSDNPFVGEPGARGEIWALGLRNPFTFAVQPGTGRIHINDVGNAAWEEIDLGRAGANYGWPECEGVCANPGFDDPIYAYGHVDGNCAITGGTFYDGTRFPAEYVGAYFFADFCGNWIRVRKPGGSVEDFATVGGAFVVDLKVGPDGGLYYLSRAAQAVNRFTFISGNRAPVAALTAAPTSGSAPLAVSFDASTSSDPDGDGLTFSWDFGDGSTAGGVSAGHTFAGEGAYLVRLTADDGRGGVGTDTVTITVGNPPSAVISLPVEGATYVAGDTVRFAGEASDAEDGDLSEDAFSWTVRFHHADHAHPHVGPIVGVTSGSFVIPTVGETSADVWYRVYLTVTDASGLRTTVTRDVVPVTSTFTLDASPRGLTLTLDGQPVVTPHTVTGVVGIRRTLSAPSPQALGSASYEFRSWSDGGATTHAISTPAEPTTYVATYAAGAGLVGSWDMDAASVAGDLLRDGSGAGNDGTVVGAVLAPGHAGDALAFDGDDYVRVPDAPSLRPQQLTLAAWIRPEGEGWRALFNKRRAGFLDSYTLRLSGSVAEFCLEPAAAATCLTGWDSPFPSGQWSHIAATWDGIRMRLYKNGVADPNTATHTAASEYSAFPVLLGAEDQEGALTFFYEGRLDDARIYGRALSPSEIAALAEEGPPPLDTEPPSVPQDLTAPAIGTGQVGLAWSASSDNVGVVGYRVYRDGGFRASTGQTAYTDEGLTASTTYAYEVTALDAAGLESGRSAPLTVTTAAAPPPGAGGRVTGLGALAGGQAFDFDVTDAPGGRLRFTDFGIVRSDGSAASATVDAAADPATGITSFAPTSAACVTFAGTARVDTGDLIAFSVDACDNGSPGAGRDALTFHAPSEDYERGGTLDEGEITLGGGTPATTLLTAGFEGGTDGFAYVDDAFRSTAAPGYASGTYLPSGGFSGGGLQVLLGGIDEAVVAGMSGGWRSTFTLDAPGDVAITLRFRLVQAANYESDEHSEALLSVDGVLHILARLTGDGNGGSDQDTGWQQVRLIVPGLAAGAHAITLGAYNNQKTFPDETTRILLDDVAVTVP